MKTFYLWVVLLTTAARDSFIARLLGEGYHVSALSGGQLSQDGPNSILVALQLEKNISTLDSKSVVIRDIRQILTSMALNHHGAVVTDMSTKDSKYYGSSMWMAPQVFDVPENPRTPENVSAPENPQPPENVPGEPTTALERIASEDKIVSTWVPKTF